MLEGTIELRMTINWRASELRMWKRPLHKSAEEEKDIEDKWGNKRSSYQDFFHILLSGKKTSTPERDLSKQVGNRNDCSTSGARG